MLRAAVFALVMAASPVIATAGPLQDLFYVGKGVAAYGKGRTPEQQALLESMKQDRMAEQLASLVTQTVRLKRNLVVGITSCGRVNAFYEPKFSRITMCLEMVELLAKQTAAEPTLASNEDNRKTVFAGALFGIFFHELGHAIIDINDIPITGREEDVADQFSLFYATNIVESKGFVMVLPTVWFFTSLAKSHDMSSEAVVKQLMSDEHSLDAQRTYNIACWALGVNRTTGTTVADFVELPKHRRERCGNEYATLDKAMRRLFGKYLVLNAPKR